MSQVSGTVSQVSGINQDRARRASQHERAHNQNTLLRQQERSRRLLYISGGAPAAAGTEAFLSAAEPLAHPGDPHVARARVVRGPQHARASSMRGEQMQMQHLVSLVSDALAEGLQVSVMMLIWCLYGAYMMRIWDAYMLHVCSLVAHLCCFRLASLNPRTESLNSFGIASTFAST